MSSTIQEVRTAIASKATTAAAVAEQHYARIAADDGPVSAGGKGIHSFLALSKERALAQAAKIDALAAKGDALPPLAGVPVGIKDVLVMQGSPATAGSKILEGYMPPYDATAVKKLEAAGAVLLGKLNCDEFAMGSSNENSAYGPVRNPRALDRVPGGSSGGSAAAVAAKLLRRDAGHRHRRLDPPARGVLRRGGRAADLRPRLALRADRLCLVARPRRAVRHQRARCRDHARRAGGQGCDGRDQLRPPRRRLRAARWQNPSQGLRIGVPAEYFGEGLDPEIRAAIEKALDGLRAAGCEIKTDRAAAHAVRHPDLLRHCHGGGFGQPFALRRRALRPARSRRKHALRHVPRDPRPGLRRGGEAPHPAGNVCAFGRLLRRLLPQGAAGAHPADPRLPGRLRRGGRHRLAGHADPAFKLGEKTDDPVQMYLEDIYSVAASLAGICGISVPCGETKAGLPIGVQIMGRHFDEETMLRVALAIEAKQT